MGIVKATLEEDYIYFLKELNRINEEIKTLPIGSLSIKKINGGNYYYHQWREGKKVKSISLGAEVPADLLEKFNRKRILEKERKDVLDNLTTISKAIDTQRVTAEEIIKIFSQSGIRFTLIGSYCLPILKENLKLSLPAIKTKDIDFLINIPYKGKDVDIESLLKPLGFSMAFESDGSDYFTNGTFKVEFLTPQKGEGTEKIVKIKPLKIKVVALRYLNMLNDLQIRVEKEGYTFSIPNPYVLAYHKIMISKYRKKKEKKENDIKQAITILKEVFKSQDMTKEAIFYLENLPPKWKKHIKDCIAEHIPNVFLNNKNTRKNSTPFLNPQIRPKPR